MGEEAHDSGVVTVWLFAVSCTPNGAPLGKGMYALIPHQAALPGFAVLQMGLADREAVADEGWGTWFVHGKGYDSRKVRELARAMGYS